MITSYAIVIRSATPADAAPLQRLAILDSREPLSGPAILAEVDGVLRAAIDLRDDSVAADPFFPTVALVELLRVRSCDQGRAVPRRRGLRSRVLRVASQRPRAVHA